MVEKKRNKSTKPKLSPKRTKAESRSAREGSVCKHAYQCGACTAIETPYAEQLVQKNAYIEDLFSGLVDSGNIRPIVGMETPFFYRNKVISPFAPGRKLPADARRSARGAKREILCGMYAANSHYIVDTSECMVENAQAKKVIFAIKNIMMRYDIAPYDEDKHTGFMRHAVIRVGHATNEMLVTLVTNSSEFPASKAFCRELVKRCPFVTTVVQNINERQTNVILGEKERTLYGPGFILDKLNGLSFRISSQSFYQVNAVQTEVLYNRALDLANLQESDVVVDAYCGTGTIGLAAAARGVRQVIGVDSVASAIRDARLNARHNGIENAQFEAQDATLFMRDCAAAGKRIDVLLMDPPRAGSTPEFIEAAGILNPERIVYISCNPTTQARDLRLLHKQGYVTQVVQPVDMFPHTDHIENIVLLVGEKNERS